MPLSVWAARASKLANKAGWTALSATVARPRVEQLHERYREGFRGGPEYVRRCVGGAYVEPQWGYVIGANGFLLEDSLEPNFGYHMPPWRVAAPSVLDFARTRRGGRRVVRYDRVVSLRHLWEWNYYHFYLDVLGKLQLFDLAGIDRSIPIVLGRYAMELPFAEQILRMGTLGERTWIVQDRFSVYADTVYYCRTQQPYKARMDLVLDETGVPKRVQPDPQDRIFLTRSRSAARYVVNGDPVERLLGTYGFRTVDTGRMTVAEQIEAFSGSRYVVAIHGAGVTNIIFRREHMLSLLELHPEGFISTDMERLCSEHGYRWHHLACRPDDERDIIHANISVDLVALEQKLRRMLDGAPSDTHPYR